MNRPVTPNRKKGQAMKDTTQTIESILDQYGLALATDGKQGLSKAEAVEAINALRKADELRKELAKLEGEIDEWL